MNGALYYYDPNHGGCLRNMKKITNDMYIINGAYGEDEGRKGHWAAIATEGTYTYKNKEYNLKVDFSMKYIKTHGPVSYTHLRAHETLMNLVCRLLLEKRL